MSRPNVVLVTTDQMRPFELGCYGHPIVRSPNIDRLATEGVRFETAVTSNPVCVPARSSLQSGQYSRTCAGSVENAYADDGPILERQRLLDTTIAEAFRGSGYETALIGKWHIHPHPCSVGYDRALFPLVPHRYSGQTYFRDFGEGYEVDQFGIDYELEEVRSFLAAPRTRPFFLSYNISLPHQPIWEGVPDRYTSMYDPEDVALRDNVWVDGTLSRSEYWFKVYLYADFFWEWLAAHRAGRNDFDETPWPLPGDSFDLRSLYALYYGGISCVDDAIGGLLEALAERGYADDTIIAFVSDHGDNLGSHDLYNKGRLIEEAIRIPLIFHAPGRLAPRVERTQIASIIDVMPTLLDMADIDIPESVQGRSLLPVVDGSVKILEPNAAFIETGRHTIGVRTERFTYGMMLDDENACVIDDAYCLFDNSEDPWQMRNLVGENTNAETALKPLLADWHERTPWLEVTE